MPTPPLLPQSDRAHRRRAGQLAAARSVYRYDFATIAPIAMAAHVPRAASFTSDFSIGFLDTVGRISMNLAAARLRSFIDPFDDLGDYAEMFSLLPAPSVIPTWRTDWRFARQRLDGVNPVVLTAVRDVAEISDLIGSQADFQARTGDSLDACLAQGRLYCCDYSLLAGLPSGGWEGGRTYLPVPRALFVWSPTGFHDRGTLLPVSITYQTTDGRTILATPADGDRWRIAKLMVQIADGNHHEMSTHLCRTHLVMEPFAVATPRQLAESHPVHLLLEPHLRFLLPRNAEARSRMLAPGAYVDTLLGSSLAGSLEIIRRSYTGWRFDEHAFPQELASRGVADPALLPDYPYRDDGMLLWEAIDAFVGRYLRLYYRSDADVVTDTELQSWCRELVASDGGRIQGLPGGGSLTTVAQLQAILTQVIFTCGPQHAAVNFPQWDYMAYCPNMPLAAYHPPDGAEALLPYLPPQRQAAVQLEIIGALSLLRYDRLGHYFHDGDGPRVRDAAFFVDPRAQAELVVFQRALEEVERRISWRNPRRRSPYPYLLPSLVPNSINV
jgi:arachidonate 15-lipoxygenase